MDVPSIPQAIVFDLDGTLVDTVDARIEAWQTVLGEAGIVMTPEQLAPMIGMDGRRLAREAAAAVGRTLAPDEDEELDRRSGERFDVLNREPLPLPGARQLLDTLDVRGTTWAIATSSRREQVIASLAALALAHPPRIVDGSRVQHAKPAPDLLLLAARELGTEPARCWYVGDSTWDMRAAVAAGMLAVGSLAGAAVDRQALRSAGAAIVVPTLAELRLPA